MRVHVSGRQTGKTTMLLAWIERDENRILVVHSGLERDRLLKEYPHIGARQIVTINDVLDGRHRGWYPRPEFAVDNLDLILPYLLGGSVGPVTYTGDYSYGT